MVLVLFKFVLIDVDAYMLLSGVVMVRLMGLENPVQTAEYLQNYINLTLSRGSHIKY